MRSLKDMKKQLIVAGLVVVGAVTLAGGAYYAYLLTPPAFPETAEEAIATIGSARYERLPEYRQEEYLEQAGRLLRELPEEERRQLRGRFGESDGAREAMGAIFMNEAVQRATDFAAASPEDKIRILDEDIDRFEQMRERFANRRPDGPRAQGEGQRRGEGGGPQMDRGGRRGDGRGGTPEERGARRRQRMMNRIEHGNPQRAALMGEYFRALGERREQRGLPPMGPRGRGR
ncbi:MAG: hypothetical protein GXY33_14720 [Phycisphaerae bacterium]|nr:hypothetical protein [Phycisphaerae bacterium]